MAVTDNTIRRSRKVAGQSKPYGLQLFLGIASVLLDILKAVDAYRNGEPGMIVLWLGSSAAISAISGILAFYVLSAWWSFGITLVLALITITLTILAMQELTLPQRLWVHRSVFGRPNHNYYDSIPFGGDKPRSLPNDPAAADEWKDYQRRALNEEAQALGMLVTGITLEVNVYKAVPIGKAGEAYDAMQRMQGVPISINISIPQNIDGVLQLEIIEKDSHKELVNDTEHQKTNKKWRYIKTGEEIESLVVDSSGKIEQTRSNAFFTITLRQSLKYNEKFITIFYFYEEKEKYIPMAKDIVNFRT